MHREGRVSKVVSDLTSLPGLQGNLKAVEAETLSMAPADVYRNLHARLPIRSINYESVYL
jgi:hypothetical protein